MAMETKFVITVPNVGERDINIWQSFGWELKSTEDMTEHTGTFLGLNFTRDTSRRNYAELAALEKEYEASIIVFPNEPGCLSGIILSILSGFILGFLTILIKSPAFYFALIAPGIVILILRNVNYKAKYATAVEVKAASEGKRAEILKKAQSLVNS
jgi:hypothetical protein